MSKPKPQTRKKRPAASAPDQLLMLKIELARTDPPIWRRFVVPASITLPKLHHVIQVVMGWSDSHLHEFLIAGERYGMPDDDAGWGGDVRAEQRVRLGKALGAARSFRYVYDFGDDWEHAIKVERRLPRDPAEDKHAICLDGANACPPDDIGGVYGYPAFVEAMVDPQHPEHDNWMEWYGGPFDPAHFDASGVNTALRLLKL